MSGRRVHVGVIGVGSLGQHHARIYAQLPEVELVGIYDVDRARAEHVAREYGTQAFESLEELVTKIEAASVVVPTDQHFEIGAKLLERKIHVLIEKPIAATTSEAEALVSFAEQQGVILQVGHVERFNPVLSVLEKHNLRPRFIEAHRLAPYPPSRPGRPPRGTEVNVVLDLMIHDLEVILHLVQSVVKDIRAVGVPVLSSTEDIANVRLLFENGCVANVTASRISKDRMRKIRCFFEDAYVSLDYQNQTGEIYRKGVFGIRRETIAVEKGEPLAHELRAFAKCVLQRDRPVVSGEHAAEALKLAVAITQRLREGPS